MINLYSLCFIKSINILHKKLNVPTSSVGRRRGDPPPRWVADEAILLLGGSPTRRLPLDDPANDLHLVNLNEQSGGK